VKIDRCWLGYSQAPGDLLPFHASLVAQKANLGSLLQRLGAMLLVELARRLDQTSELFDVKGRARSPSLKRLAHPTPACHVAGHPARVLGFIQNRCEGPERLVVDSFESVRSS
jgi:hypothetical protein